MPELQATIGADASDLIRETRTASRAWSRFTDSLASDGKKATRAFSNITKATSDLTSEVRSTTRSLARLDFRGATSGARGLASSVGNLVSSFGSLAGSLGRIGFNALAAGADVALGAVKNLAVGLGVLTAALVGIGAKATSEFASFQTAFSQVRTLVDESQTDIKALEDGVRDLAVRFGTDLKGATQAAYQAISAGIGPAETVKFLETAFKGAAAGAAEVSEVTDLVTSALNAFNKPVEEAARVSDIFFTTVRLGKTTITELSASIGQVAPIASAAGVALEDVGSAFAALTASGVNSAEAATQIKAAITGLIKPSNDAGKALREIGVDAQLLREQGLGEVFRRLREATGGSTEALARFLPNVRALQGAATLAGVGFDKFNKALDETRNSAGATDAAFQKVEANLSVAFGRLQASITDTFVSLGQLIAPAVQSAANALTRFRDNTRRDFDALADAFTNRFGPGITKFFEDLIGGSQRSGSIVSTALRSAGSALRTFAGIVQSNANVIATLVASFQGLGKVVVLVAQSVRAVLGAALASIGGVITGLLTAIEALASAVGADGLARDLEVARRAAEAFTESVATDTAEAATAAAETISSFDELGDTFNATRRAATNLSSGLLAASNGAKQLADDVDAARARTDATAAATSKAADSVTKLTNATKQASAAQAQITGSANAARTAVERMASANAQAASRASELFAEVNKGKRTIAEATEELARYRQVVQDTEGVTVMLADVLKGASGAADTTKLSAEQLTGVLKALGSQGAETAASTIRVKTSATELFNAARLGVISVEQATRALRGLTVAIKGVGTVTIATRSALDLFNDAASRAFGGVKVEADDLSRRVRGAFETIDTTLRGRFREAAEVLVAKFGEGKTASNEFLAAVRNLENVQGSFIDPAPLENFIRIAGTGGRVLNAFGEQNIATFRTISNVLRGEFRSAADVLVRKLAEGRIETAKFRDEIRNLASQQLGFDQIFRGVDELAENLTTIRNEAKAAAGALGTDLRAEVEKASESFRAGKTSLDDYLDAIIGTGERVQRFKSLTEDQVVAFERLRKENEEVADKVLDLSQALDRRLKPAFASLLQAFRAGRLTADQLAVGLGRLTAQQKELAEATRATTTTLNEAQAAEAKFFEEIDKGFAALENARKGFEGTQAGAKLLDEGLGRLVPKITELRNRTSDAGRALLDKLLDGFAKGRLGAKDLREELQRLADATVNVGRQAQQAGGRVEQAFAGGGGIAAFGGRPGQIGFGRQSLSGFGIQGRVTGSSNFSSNLEQQVGEALGLKPKALRQRAARSGGLEALASEIGLRRFVEGGRVSQTGPAKVEAGEFVLSRRGLADLGTLFAEMLNKGQGGAGVTQNNTFNVMAPEAERFSERALAFALKPALMQVGQLAASRSPIT